MDGSIDPLMFSGKTLLETLKKKVNERGAKGIIGLVKAFKIIDADKSNTISMDEFKQGLKNYKLGFDDADIESVFKEFDRNHDSQLDIQEFIRTLKAQQIV
jgi:calcium-binding protein CML